MRSSAPRLRGPVVRRSAARVYGYGLPFPRAYGYVTPAARRYGYGYALRVNGVSPPPVSARRSRAAGGLGPPQARKILSPRSRFGGYIYILAHRAALRLRRARWRAPTAT